MVEEIKKQLDEYYLTLKSQTTTSLAYYDSLLNNDEEYVQLSNKLGTLKLQIAKNKFNNIDSDELIKEVGELNRKIDKIKDKFKKYEKISYLCNKCKDSGYDGENRCICYKKNLTKFTLKSLGITEDKPINLSKLQPPKGLDSFYRKTEQFIEKFPQTKLNNIIIGGKTGTGKTYLSKVISQKITQKGYNSIFLTSTELNNIFIKMHINDKDKGLFFEILSTSDLLVIDDLGTEPIYNNITCEYLNSLISERLKKNKHFIITTNLLPDEIKNRYTERFFSRVYDKTKSIYFEFNTADLRFV